MKLLIDIGNSRIKWAFEQDGQLSGPGELVHRGMDSDPALTLIDQLEFVPEFAVAINVAGQQLGAAVAAVLLRRHACQLEFVQTAATAGDVANGYVAIDQLGADRWAALVTAWHDCREAVCVVDAGSALTIDLVGGAGNHYGGIIVPGISLLQSALLADTSDIAGFVARSQISPDSSVWYGRDTASAVERGSLFATISLIEAAVKDFPEAGVIPRLYLTGGDAPLLLKHLVTSAEHRPHLVLEGLSRLAANSF